MSELAVFIRLGFRHITDVEAMDHMLFLLALAAIYRPRDWRGVLWVISAFTVGHSITLALAVTQVVAFPTAVIEFLIPLTIAATAVANVALPRSHTPTLPRSLFAGLFGLVHGAGFANYLTSLSMDHLALPLFGFNVGIELGQIVVLATVGVLLVGLDWLIVKARVRVSPDSPVSLASPLRLRTLAISSVVALVAARWSMERVPW